MVRLSLPLVIASVFLLGCSQNSDDSGSSESTTTTLPSGDTTAPQVSSVTGPSSTAYGPGLSMTFTVLIDEVVTVTGTPRLTLAIGSDTEYATYVTGTGSNTLTFRYTIQTGDSDSNGIAVAASIDLNGGTIKDSAGNNATLTFTSPNTTSVHVLDCPTNFVPVPALTGYTTSPFCIAKYEMKNDGLGTPVSQPTGTPWTTIDRTTSATECASMVAGTGNFTLITNAQWQTTARDVELQATNWSGGGIGSVGGLSIGHSDGTPLSTLAASGDDTDACYGTGQTCDLNTWDQQRRTFQLSNGAIVWDLAGNIWEWVAGDNNTDFGTDTALALVTDTTHPTIGTIGGLTGTAKFHFGASGDYTSLTTGTEGGIGAGIINYTSGGIFRGNRWNSITGAGVFRVQLNQSTSWTHSSLGFRCVWTP